MKPLIISLMVLATSVAAYSQDAVKYRAFQTSYYDDEVEEIEWNEVDILVVFNTEKDLIRIFAKKEKNIDIINRQKEYVNKDGNNVYKYTGVDEDGIKCTIELIKYSGGNTHVATLIIRYQDVTLAYRLKNN
jgi:hypothetical protein